MNDDIPVEEEVVAAEELENGSSPRVASHREWELGEVVIVLLFALPVLVCVLLVIFLTVLT